MAGCAEASLENIPICTAVWKYEAIHVVSISLGSDIILLAELINLYISHIRRRDANALGNESRLILPVNMQLLASS